MQFRRRVLDRQRMKTERVGQDQRFRDGRVCEIDPDRRPGNRAEPRWVDARGLFRPAVPANENGDHRGMERTGSGDSHASPEVTQSPTLTDSAAWAAARRATGTRYGDELT